MLSQVVEKGEESAQATERQKVCLWDLASSTHWLTERQTETGTEREGSMKSERGAESHKTTNWQSDNINLKFSLQLCAGQSTAMKALSPFQLFIYLAFAEHSSFNSLFCHSVCLKNQWTSGKVVTLFLLFAFCFLLLAFGFCQFLLIDSKLKIWKTLTTHCLKSHINSMQQNQVGFTDIFMHLRIFVTVCCLVGIPLDA